MLTILSKNSSTQNVCNVTQAVLVQKVTLKLISLHQVKCTKVQPRARRKTILTCILKNFQEIEKICYLIVISLFKRKNHNPSYKKKKKEISCVHV
jgi:hypothetical protein